MAKSTVVACVNSITEHLDMVCEGLPLELYVKVLQRIQAACQMKLEAAEADERTN